MSLGNLPGFYWDEQRKRYFKVQEDHKVPAGVSYSRGSVTSKKRRDAQTRVEKVARVRRERQSVKRSPILQHPLTAIGLSRELGLSSRTQCSTATDSAILSEWRPHTTKLLFSNTPNYSALTLADAQFLPASQQMILAFVAAGRMATLHMRPWSWTDNTMTSVDKCPLAAIHHGIMNVLVHQQNTDTRIVVCSNEQYVFMGHIQTTIPAGEWAVEVPGLQLSLGQPGESLTAAAMNATTGNAAIASTRKLFVLDPSARVSSALPFGKGEQPLPERLPPIDWLDHNTLAYGDYTREVHLWDTRTSHGVASRFAVHSYPLTGIFNPWNNEKHNLLICTNHHMRLYDTRMPKADGQRDQAVLALTHPHGDPHSQLAADGHGLVAAVDRDNTVQVYSLRNGTRLRSLRASTAHDPPIRRLTWYDDLQHGSALQAVRGNAVVRWTWDG